MEKKKRGFGVKSKGKNIRTSDKGKTKKSRINKAVKSDFVSSEKNEDRPYQSKKNTNRFHQGIQQDYAVGKRPYKRHSDDEKPKEYSGNKNQGFQSGSDGGKRPYKRRTDAEKPKPGYQPDRKKDTRETTGYIAKRTYKARSEEQKSNRTFGVKKDKDLEPTEHKPFKTPGGYREYKRRHTELTRLNKYISNAGYCSRREADTLITAGSVSVDGKIITELGFKINPGAVVKIDKQTIRPEKLRYILLNKPKDVITTCDDPQGRKTVLHLIRGACKERVYPVGRLDRNTTGLLVMTNDGEFAKKIAHPSSKVKKLYEVTLDKRLKQEHFEEISKGVWLDEQDFVDVDDLAFADGSKGGNVIGIEIHSGKNHVVRRIFEKYNYIVTKLDRTKIDILTKKDLPRGRWRFLSDSEVQLLSRL
jgi:23S rRNA pseudouridine2605 synthase